WLFRVAVRVASRARSRAPVLPPVDRPTPAGEVGQTDAVAAVYEEVARLPDKYRLPVLLCELEGQTHAEAATRLGWPVGTVSGRLSLARRLLRDRLTRRGIMPAIAVLALARAGSAPAASVQSSVASAGGGPVPPAVASLTEGVLTAMRWAKLKLVATALATVAVVVAAVSAATIGESPIAPPSINKVPAAAAETPPQPESPPKAEAPPKPADMFPTAAGSVWEYDYTQEKAAGSGTIMVKKWAKGASGPEAELEALRLVKGSGAVEPMQVTPKSVTRQTSFGVQTIWKSGSKAGDKWEEALLFGGTGVAGVQAKVGKPEEIKVPAGTYTATPVVTEMKITYRPGEAVTRTEKVTTWFAPGAGIVKQECEITNNGAVVNWSMELKKYTPGK
ncbi:MAG: hypothetical protein C0506_17025, partial [Anaerolinea sp.]|nr:hypothetical protein [Anaerolinea sp.]